MIIKNPVLNGTNGKNSLVGKTPQSNGTKQEQKPEEKKEEMTSSIVPLPKDDSKLSIEDRFFKMDILISKREKWEKIKDSLDKLNKFKLSTDGRSDNITLKDGAGNSFSTYNAEVLSTVVDLLKVDLTKKLAEVEQEINF